jgi:hypothetical protein
MFSSLRVSVVRPAGRVEDAGQKVEQSSGPSSEYLSTTPTDARMSDDPLTDRIVKEIGLRTFADRYLDASEEVEVIRIAEQLGMDRTAALAVIGDYCKETGTVREGTVRDAIRVKLSTIPDRLDRAAFDIVTDAAQTAAGTALPLREVQRMTITVMEETGRNHVKRGWFRNWYADLKRELGVV